jgi:hypothetical protein
VKWGHCRNRIVASVLALAMASTALAASYWWDWQRVLSEVMEKNPGVSKAELAEEITFSRFLELKKESGWKIGKSSGSSFNGGGVTFIWVVEALVVQGIAELAVGAKAAEPYCEKCRRWCDERTFYVPHSSRADADPYLTQGDLGRLAQIDGRADADPNVSLHFTVTTCAGCNDTAFLTVAEQTVKQTKKQTNTTKVELVKHAVLSADHRALASDRVQAAVGQKVGVA